MKVKLRNITKGRAEIHGNTHPGGRYVMLAVIQRDDSDGFWRFASDNEHADRFGELPAFTNAYSTRAECVWFVKRWYLIKQARRAIEDGKGLSRKFWHCPCRDAFSDMWDSGLFSIAELEAWHDKMEASGNERQLGETVPEMP